MGKRPVSPSRVVVAIRTQRCASPWRMPIRTNRTNPNVRRNRNAVSAAAEEVMTQAAAISCICKKTHAEAAAVKARNRRPDAVRQPQLAQFSRFTEGPQYHHLPDWYGTPILWKRRHHQGHAGMAQTHTPIGPKRNISSDDGPELAQTSAKSEPSLGTHPQPHPIERKRSHPRFVG